MKAIRETFAGRRRAPELFGLEHAALYPIAGAWTCAAMGLSFLHMAFHVTWTVSFALTCPPATAVTVVCLFLIQGKPRGFFFDWVQEVIFFERHTEFPARKPPAHPYHAPRSRT